MQTELLYTTAGGITLYRLSNADGMRVEVMDYGARLFGVWVPTPEGAVNVLAGFDDPDGFRGDNPYFNALIGRVANRIDHGTFLLDGKRYDLCCNDGAHHLHGGAVGFDRRMWTVLSAADGAITLRYVSPDGEEGYPGTLTVTVTYRLDEQGGLSLDYEATTDRATPVNLTNPAYFNLDGDFRSVRDHRVRIAGDRVLTADAELIPHGQLLPVADTEYDFRTLRTVGALLPPVVDPVPGQGGYDIGYVLCPHSPDEAVATAVAEHSGIRMDVYTDRPVLQFYTGNFLDGSVVGRHAYGYQSAFCMETQDYSNAPTVPAFPSVTLRAGETYRAHTLYRFCVEK